MNGCNEDDPLRDLGLQMSVVVPELVAIYGGQQNVSKAAHN